MKNLLKPILLAAAILLTSFANAQIGSAPLREGKTVQANLELVDTSMVWLAVDFENISHPSFQLNDLIINFETTSRNPLRDFYYFSPYKRDGQGKSYYMVGLSLPTGSYKITNISGKAGNFLIGGNMSFNLEIPLRITNVGQHYYLGNISIQNVSTENNQLQRSGGRLPLIDQAISGYGNGTLNFNLRDKVFDDVPIIKGLFPSVSTLQGSNFEKKLISFIKIPYALGQGLEPLAVRMQQLNQIESNANATIAAPVDINTAHSLPVPVGTNFAPSLELALVPQRMSDPMKRIYALYVDSKRTKALAISGYGAIGLGFGAEAMKTAIDNCEKIGKPCALYAVNSTVVWNPEAPLAQAAKAEQEKTALTTGNLRPTGFANIDDFEAVPLLSAKGKELYVEWLGRSNPKAVAISDKGAMYRGYGESAVSVALDGCKGFGRACKIYGLNNDVVFEPFAAVHDTAIPADTGFAKVSDTSAVPAGSPRAKQFYENWLDKPIPKAIAINEAGQLYYSSGGDSMQLAMQYCDKSSKPCKLYAVDSTVVFTPFASKHTIPVPVSTQFSEVGAIEAVPKLSKNGKDNYQFWLTRGNPKAFALSDAGGFGYKLGPDSQTEALKACETMGKPCKLYAVDDTVVWEKK